MKQDKEMKQFKEMAQARESKAGQSAKCDFIIQWHLTERCNLRCRHCHSGGLMERQRTSADGELSLSEIKEVLTAVSEMSKERAGNHRMKFSPSFNITGGEPFLRQDVFEILEEIRRRGFELNLLSNGTLIGKNRAEKLAEIGVEGVQISIEGPESVHDSIRGRGSFAAALRGIEKLLGSGIRVTMNATLSRLSAGCVSALIELARTTGVQRLGFSRLVPTGRALGLFDETLTGAQAREAYEALLSFRRNGGGLEVLTGGSAAGAHAGACSENSGCTAVGGCVAGVSALTFLPDGTVTPCRRLDIPIGNVREGRLRDIWVNSGVLGELRDKSKYKGRCGACDRWDGCRGCRAAAYAYTKTRGPADFLAEDPQCFMSLMESLIEPTGRHVL